MLRSQENTRCLSHVSKGAVVIVHDDSLPRGLWKLGRIQELFTGQDGLPCSALVMVLQGTATHIVEEASTTFVPFGSC